jgi:hypothetical protein
VAITEAFAGSQTVDGTEWSLTTDTGGPDTETSDGIFQCFLDLNALALGDTFEFRIYEKTQSGDTQRVCFYGAFSNAQGADAAIAVSPALVLLNGWDMTLKKTAGTDRAITWSIRKVA